MGGSDPLPSRIVFACDAFHAMTSNRPFRSARDREEDPPSGAGVDSVVGFGEAVER